jgi:hypothetical protein
MMLRAVSSLKAGSASFSRAGSLSATSSALPKLTSPLISSILDDDTNRRAEQQRSGNLLALPFQYRALHTSAHSESSVLIVGLGVAGVATAAVYGLKAYEKYAQAKAAAEPPSVEGDAPGEDQTAESSAKDKASEAPKADAKKEDKEKAGASSSSSGGGMFGAQAFARRFYKGGFEDRMTRREAALILGVR